MKRMSAIAAVALVVAACGGGDDEAAEPPTVSATQTTPTETQATDTETTPPEATGSPVARRTLVGEWVRTGQILYVRFERNGQFAMDQLSLDEPDIGGTYEFEGGIIRFANEIEGPCASGTGWAWDAQIVDDELHVTFVEGGCAVPTGEMWILERRLEP
jgi:hypothetical protein